MQNDESGLADPKVEITKRSSAIAAGVGLEFLAALVLVLVMYVWLKHSGGNGNLIGFTVPALVHLMFHTLFGAGTVVVSAAIYLAGAVVLAEGYVKRGWQLFFAVPLAALVGFFIIGFLFIIVLILFVILNQTNTPPWMTGNGRRKRGSQTPG